MKQIFGFVKRFEVVKSIYEGMNDLNVEKAFKDSFSDTPEFNFIGVHGRILNYSEFFKMASGVYNRAKKAEFEFASQDIRVVSRELVIVSFRYKGTLYFNKSSLSFPYCGTSMVLNKTDDVWKVIHMQESLQESKFVRTKF